MGGRKAHLFVQNFDAVLIVIVISAGDAIFAKFQKKKIKHVTLHVSSIQYVVFSMKRFFEVCRRQRRARPWARPWGQTQAHMDPRLG